MKQSLFALLLSVIALGQPGAAKAEEPGFISPYTQGSMIGVPKALPLDQPFMFVLGMDHYDTEVYDNDGHSLHDKYHANAITPSLLWAPGIEILGGQYRTGISIPLLNVNGSKVNPALGPTGDYTEYGIGNVQITPFDVAWHLGGGWFASAGLNIYTPLNTYDVNKVVRIGSAQWVFEPNIALSYVGHDGWMASFDAHYTVNTENSETDYRTGDQFFATAWVTKNIGGVSIGPAAYYDKQVTKDRNSGSDYFGLTFDSPEHLAFGAVANYRFANKMTASLFYTHDVLSRNSGGGNRFWFRLAVPFGD